jgi:phospholipid-translocating ATPase
MVASRIIKESDYISWINNIRKSEKFQKNSKLIEKLYDIMECNFELLGGTVLEDKLQNKVPETITSLKLADIRIWVLTGDKMDTVENIGISCNLLSYHEKIFKIKMFQRDDYNDNDNMELYNGLEIRNFIADFKSFLEKNIQELKEKKNLHVHPQYRYDMDSFEQNSISDSDLNVKYLHNLKEKRLISNFSIIIESPLLNTLFKDDELTEKFLSIAQYATTVMCCRASPYQKSQVVKKIKRFNPNFVTLAIGDGRNDISMLMEANIGVGIYGEEGTSAAQAADFAIGEFKLLRRLLFFHGRVNMN